MLRRYLASSLLQNRSVNSFAVGNINDAFPGECDQIKYLNKDFRSYYDYGEYSLYYITGGKTLCLSGNLMFDNTYKYETEAAMPDENGKYSKISTPSTPLAIMQKIVWSESKQDLVALNPVVKFRNPGVEFIQIQFMILPPSYSITKDGIQSGIKGFISTDQNGNFPLNYYYNDKRDVTAYGLVINSDIKVFTYELQSNNLKFVYYNNHNSVYINKNYQPTLIPTRSAFFYPDKTGAVLNNEYSTKISWSTTSGASELINGNFPFPKITARLPTQG
ncbi:hypothetical protein TVAG_165110 [Trichomonas vaginalis G3]|uniref:Uncharacterized protein n=1 Tax=Trichomonas vaginalis (strain ATCC PRA-98 / G3) TaxID=412133 RepID=A2DUJ2_TRIV3|nr:hypothetical protein TVAGG3_0663230 [Trichomonas vaginalis G3]EAY15883.1 hypothetical protein TVAG_165110 [Trichomonas vaginalis G3]KAI5506658.1 hypothetical protein TVAGG3_0663230 [Trichomonas vaginalis G3]|eukprot:XP_001328106.1 hypothetical protein [Trichomonas vaginalis G3]